VAQIYNSVILCPEVGLSAFC